MQGDSKVDELMCPVRAALDRHVKDRDAKTEIYNRAYEALQTSMEGKFDQKPMIELSAIDFETKYVSRSALNNIRSRAERAESIIRGMFPMWLSAMSYCEHGRAADLDRMRNYYNGRDNPLTSEEIHVLFSMKEGEK